MAAQRHQQIQQWAQLPDWQGLGDEYDGRSVSLDAQPPRRSRSNRASIQTSNTDALTESTFSPHSPTASSSVGATHGLAPRPPSDQNPTFSTTYAHAGAGADGGHATASSLASSSSSSSSSPFGAAYFPQEPVLELSKAMSRRQKYPSAERYQEEAFESTAATPPAAPDVPPVPPVSYRQPHSHHPALPHNHRQNQFMPSVQLVEDEEMDPENHYTTRRQEHSDFAAHHAHGVTDRKGIVATHNLSQDVTTGSPRRESLNGPSERRKKFANDRSPLQRLELTLDSMTKEEKRARVQAAEQRARERAARRAAEASAIPPGDVHSPNRPSEHQTYRPTPTTQFPTAFKREPPPQKSERREQPCLQHQTQHHPRPQQDVFRPSVVERSHAVASPPALLRPEDDEELEQPRSNLPKRNLSFRERAARNEQEPQVKERSPTGQPTAFFTGGNTGGLSLTRNGSNELQKNSHPDRLSPQRAQSPRENAGAGGSRSPGTRQPHILAIGKNNEVPPVPASEQPTRGIQRRATEPVHEREYGSDEGYDPRQMHGKIPNAAVRSPNREFGDAAAARRRLERQDSDHSMESAPQHRVSRLIFKPPQSLRPGEGLYKPPVWLDEYEKATVGFLGGNLLDLTESQPSGQRADKGKAWWENGGRNRNASYSSRPRKAEAFDGEYDDTNGM